MDSILRILLILALALAPLDGLRPDSTNLVITPVAGQIGSGADSNDYPYTGFTANDGLNGALQACYEDTSGAGCGYCAGCQYSCSATLPTETHNAYAAIIDVYLPIFDSPFKDFQSPPKHRPPVLLMS
jgi:hypothetical protein